MSDKNNEEVAGAAESGNDSTKRNIEEVSEVTETSQAKKIKLDDNPAENVDVVAQTLLEIDTTYLHFTDAVKDMKNKRAEFNKKFLKLKERLENTGVLKEYPKQRNEGDNPE